jgi:hypothetical protein
MDIEALMTQKGMRDWTDGQRDTFTNDAVQVRQLAQIVQARLANTRIDGDGAGTSGRRARKVAKRLAKVARLLEKAAAETEAVNAVYVREVLELPDRRAKEVERKADRRQRFGIAASGLHAKTVNSLTASTHHLTGTPTPVNPQVNAVPPVAYVNPQPHQFPGQNTTAQPLPNIHEFFNQEAM